MKRANWFSCTLSLAALLMASSLEAQTYYLRGDFNGWGTSDPMIANGDGSYSATVTGTAGTRFQFKIALADWSSSWPGSNARSIFDASGSFTANFRPGAVADGWNPGSDRVGYKDPSQFGWEIMGSWNGWSSPVLSLTSMGNGLYSGDYLVASPGSYDFKFREAGSWDISVGGDFGNSAGNANVTTLSPNELVRFQLDLPNGRWSAAVVPEPTSLSLLAGGMILLALRAKRDQK
jgi:hypothetical protein